MQQDDIHEQIAELLRQAERRGYARGVADTKKRMAQALDAIIAEDRAHDDDVGQRPEPAIGPAAHGAEKRPRAPRGLVPKVILQAVKLPDAEAPDSQGVLSRIRSFGEYRPADSSIRAELRRMEDKGRLYRRNGRWYAADGDDASQHNEGITVDESEGAPEAVTSEAPIAA